MKLTKTEIIEKIIHFYLIKQMHHLDKLVYVMCVFILSFIKAKK